MMRANTKVLIVDEMVVMFWIVLYSLLLGGVSSSGIVLCPLSSVMDLNGTYNYFYPMDIYGTQEQFLKANASNELYRCDADERIERRSPHYCSKKMERFCPIHIQNVKDATSKKYHRSSSLCHFKAKLADKTQNINVIVMGGSVTAGSAADNCHADYPVVPGHVPNRRCTWPYHFGEWLNRTYDANVAYYNLGESSQNCFAKSLTFPDELTKLYKIHQFTENDIIFLDHSMNDQGLRQQVLIEKGLEHLIRRIYSYSAANSWPSIVVLDAHPVDFFHPKEWLFPAAYEKIVRHYNLSMWSNREAVHSNYSLTHQKNITEYLRWKRSLGGDFHPVWHVHLFMADLYASIFQTELNHCSSHLVDMALQLHRSAVPKVPALSLSSSENTCDASTRPYLSISYFDHVNGIPFIGNYSVKPRRDGNTYSTDSWQLREDRPTKGGFIEELPEGVYPSVEDSASIVFQLANTTEEMLKDGLHSIPLLQLVYLRTYENAGFVEVFLCDQKIGGVDGLWEKFETTKISVPEFFMEGLRIKELCTNHTYPYVTVSHRNGRETKIRGRHKFKIVGIKVCKVFY